MNCKELTEILSGLVDGRVSAAERGAAQSHLASCAACRAQERWLQAMKTAAAGVPPAPMPAGLKAGLMAQARAASRRKSARRRREWLSSLLRPAAGLGLAAGLASAAFLLVPRGSQAPVEMVAMDDLLAAHREYAATLPLASPETALAGGRP